MEDKLGFILILAAIIALLFTSTLVVYIAAKFSGYLDDIDDRNKKERRN